MRIVATLLLALYAIGVHAEPAYTWKDFDLKRSNVHVSYHSTYELCEAALETRAEAEFTLSRTALTYRCERSVTVKYVAPAPPPPPPVEEPPPPPPPVVETGTLMTWTPPTEYTDGTPIQSGDLTGFGIHCGPSTDYLFTSGTTEFIRVPFATAYRVNLAPGTHYCAVSAMTATTSSALSNIQMVTVQ